MADFPYRVYSYTDGWLLMATGGKYLLVVGTCPNAPAESLQGKSKKGGEDDA